MSGGDFEKVGYLVLSGSKKNLKITINGATYFVAVSDVQKALRMPKFAAQIVRVCPAAVLANSLDSQGRNQGKSLQ